VIDKYFMVGLEWPKEIYYKIKQGPQLHALHIQTNGYGISIWEYPENILEITHKIYYIGNFRS